MTGLSPAATFAHEFWLLPNSFTLSAGDPLTIELRNGENMKGISLPYLPGGVTRFELHTADATTPITARLGDDPVSVTTPAGEGLLIVLHETTDNLIIYKDMAKFAQFANHKGWSQAVTQHSERGLPENGFSESYRRYAKSLVAVEAGAGADRATGLRIEIVAQANPYTDDVTAGVPLLVLLDGAPRPAAQLEVFATAPDGTVTASFYTTDANGIALVPAAPGVTYLADTVDLYALPNTDVQAGPVWHTDWASLTYRVP